MRYYQKDNFLTVKEVAEFLKLSELTLYKYIREGALNAVEFGGHYRIDKTSLETFIEQHKVRKETPDEK